MVLGQLSPEITTALIDGLIRGDYHILLGAGASMGSHGGDREPLPAARQLAKDLLSAFGVTFTDEDYIDLRSAYDVVEYLRDPDGKDRQHYLQRRFSNCSPTWQNLLGQFYWKRIWTLNIDDTVENAYSILGKSARQSLVRYTWTSPYREPARSSNELQLIHLHGSIQDNASPSGLVFSIVEYLQVTASRHAWHRVFGDEFLQRPFIVVGASLSDEFDLADILRRGNSSIEYSGKPSFVVLQRISPIQRVQFQKWGLIPIEGTAADVFGELRILAEKAEAQRARVLPFDNHNVLPPSAQAFLQQFRWLKLDSPSVSPPKHDFYAGEDPEWPDILSDLDAEFDISKAVTSMVQADSVSGNTFQRLYYIGGPPGSGKSALLLRVARRLIVQGFGLFLFRQEETLNIDACLWWIRNMPRCVFIVDGIADFAHDFANLLGRCRQENLEVALLGAERLTREYAVFDAFPADVLTSQRQFKAGQLTDQDVDALLTKLDSARRLGILTRRSHASRRDYFKKEAKRQLLVAMLGLEGSIDFSKRLANEYSVDLRSSLSRQLYALACISYTFGYVLPIGIACAAAGIPAGSLQRELAGSLGGVLIKVERGLRPRHRVIASTVVNVALDHDIRYRLLQALARSLAPYVGRDAERAKSLPYRIAKSILDENIISGWVGSARLSAWYSELAADYDWSARFWEQRALAEARLRKFPRARSFAEEAVKRHPDFISFNTLGHILLRMSTEYYVAGSPQSLSCFWDGVDQVRTSRTLAAGRFEHPFNTFFTKAIRFAKVTSSGNVRDPRLLTEWSKWMAEARVAEIFQHARLQEQLEQYQREWLLMMVA